jgi:DNA-binding phage protein
MALTRDFKNTVVERLKNDPAFAKGLLEEAATLFINGEPETARALLRNLINASIGFEKISQDVKKDSKSLQRMLSAKGNPSMNNLADIFRAIQTNLNVSLEVQHHRTTKAA